MIADIRHSLRAIVRAPLTSGVIVLSLAVGIGVNTVVFSWIQAFTLRPLPGVANAARFHLIEPVTDAALRPGASWLEYRDLAAESRALRDLIAFRMVPLNVGTPPETERASALLVSANYFSALGLQPALGRFLRPDEADVPGRAPVVVVSYDYWQTRLGADPQVVGRSLTIEGTDLAIVGVAPERFQGTVLGLQFDLWVPATMAPVVLSGSRELEDRGVRGYYVMGALSDRSTLAQAQGEASAVMQRLADEFPQTNAAVAAEVLPFWRAGRGPQGMLLQGLAILQGVMLVLLLAVCGNTANLVLARATARIKDVGVRVAVGAGRWGIMRLLMVESLLLGIAAAAGGIAIAAWGTNALRAMPMLTTRFPVRFQTDLDVQTMAFATALGVGAALLFGGVPAVHLARVAPHVVLRTGIGQTGMRGLRMVIMGGQVALAAIVLVVAALFFKSFQQTQQTDPGFTTQGVLLASYDLSGRNVSRDESRVFAARLLERLRALPDVDAAALATSVPLDIHGLPARDFLLEGRPRADVGADRTLSNTVTPGYFAVMGIPIVAGSDFAELDDASAPPQAIVNDTFVRRYLQDGEPLARQLTIGSSAYTIIGVVRTTLNESFSEPPTPAVYLSYRDRPSTFAEMHIRTAVADEMVLLPSVRQALRELDASLPVFNARTLAQHVEMNLVLRRIPAQMFMVLGPLLLVLAAIGIYAVVAYNVAQRTAEIGVRLALGARRSMVVRHIIAENMRVVIVGAGVGCAAVAYVFTRFLRGELDPLAFAVVPAFMLVVAAAACWVPARRASRVDPVAALRVD